MGRWNSLHFGNLFWKSFILLLFSSISTTAIIEINEVMYAPSEAFGGQYNEWLELFNSGNESVNLSSCFLDSKKNLPQLVILPKEYFIVARKPDIFLNIYSYNGTIIEQSLSLNNDLDTIILNGTCSSQLNYNSALGGYKNNQTLERRANGTWAESIVDGGSPGKPNSLDSIEEDIKIVPPDITTNITTNFTTNITTNITTNFSLPPNFTIPSIGEKPCNIGLSLSGDPIINGTKLNFTVTVENKEKTPINITVRGKIETLDKKIIKEYSPWTDLSLSNFSQKEKDYFPSIDDGVYLVTFYMENMSCVDHDNSDNTIQKIFVKPTTLSHQNSTISIDSIPLGSDKKARWGDQLSVRLSIYKSNENKSEASVWAEVNDTKVSKTTSFLLPEENHLSTLTVPLQLDANCNQKINADHLVIVTEAFGLRTKKEIPISGISSELCKTITVEKTVLTSSSSLKSSSSSSSTSTTSRAASITISVPPSINAGEVLPVTVHLKGTTVKKKFTLSGYAYRGKTCYSCSDGSRDQNEVLKTITLEKNQEKDQEILLKIDSDVAEGILKVKVKMTQEGLKTPQEATFETYILPPNPIISTRNLTTPPLFNSPSSIVSNTPLSQITSPQSISHPGVLVYESTSAKTRKTIPYFLIAAFALLSVSLVLNRK